MEKRNYSGKSQENQKKFKTTTHKKVEDPCAVCDEELYFDEEVTQRVGLLNDFDEVIGWMCPHCRSEFDVDGKIRNLGGKSNITGEA